MSESGQRRWWLLVGLWLLYAAFGLTATSLAPLVAPIEADLNITHAEMGTLMGAWQLVFIFTAVPCGVLLDRLGARWSILIGGSLIVASALGRALAVDYWSFLLAVMLFGVGGPIISSGAPKVVAQLFVGSQRGLAMGIYMTGVAMGGVVSLTVTNSVLVPFFDGDWRDVMTLWALVGALATLLWFALASLFNLRKDESVLTSNEPPESQLQALRSLIRVPSLSMVLLMAVGVFMFNHGLNNWLPELLRGNGLTIVEAGYWAALPTVVGIFASLIIPRLATPERRYNILIGLCVCALVASILLQYSHPALMTVGLLVQGIARATLMTILVLALVELPGVGERRAGTASGLFFSAAEIGGVLGPIMLGVLYDVQGHFVGALYGMTAIALLLSLGGVRLRRLNHPA